MGDSQALTGIASDEIRDQYKRRNLIKLSDAELLAGVAGIVAHPRHSAANSFVLHAPLELAARASLLPLTRPQHRDLARMHIVALAAQYEAADEPADFGEVMFEPHELSADQMLTQAIADQDLLSVDHASALIANGPDPVATTMRLADVVAPLTAAAAHAPIFLYHLHRQRPVSGISAELLRPLARELARNPSHRIRWLDELRWNEISVQETDPHVIANALRSTPLLGPPESTFIHALLMRADAETAPSVLESVLGGWNDASANAILRVAAQSMLLDTRQEAPYGWTHCLTIPQALLGVASWSTNPALLLGLGATHVVAFRASLGQVDLPELDAAFIAGLPVVDRTDIATQAACSHDAHVVKYVLACLDAAHHDTGAAPLYLNAAQHLLNVWADNGGDPTDPLA